MKIKVIFLLFNAVILLSFLSVFFLPIIMLGSAFSMTFWKEVWHFPVLFILAIAAIDSYFIMNWNLFQLLEKEDWTGVITFLEKKIYDKNKISRQSIKILINSYLVTGRSKDITRLEVIIREKKPALFKRFVLSFAIPRILKSDPALMEHYFSGFAEDKSVRERCWVMFFHAFSLLLQNKRGDAGKILLKIIGETRESILLLLSLYNLSSFTPNDDEVKKLVEEKKLGLRNRYSRESWNKEVEKGRNNITILLLSQMINEAGEWLFRENPSK